MFKAYTWMKLLDEQESGPRSRFKPRTPREAPRKKKTIRRRNLDVPCVGLF